MGQIDWVDNLKSEVKAAGGVYDRRGTHGEVWRVGREKVTLPVHPIQGTRGQANITNAIRKILRRSGTPPAARVVEPGMRPSEVDRMQPLDGPVAETPPEPRLDPRVATAMRAQDGAVPFAKTNAPRTRARELGVSMGMDLIRALLKESHGQPILVTDVEARGDARQILGVHLRAARGVLVKEGEIICQRGGYSGPYYLALPGSTIPRRPEPPAVIAARYGRPAKAAMPNILQPVIAYVTRLEAERDAAIKERDSIQKRWDRLQRLLSSDKKGAKR